MDLPEMTYEQWCQNSKALLAECAKYDQWRKRTKLAILTDLAPRIAKLSQQMYNGRGFHYSKEQSLGNLIVALAIPYQWCANHCAKIPEQRIDMITNQVIASSLFQEVVEAEKSAAEWTAKNSA